jgi:hypothetical protein
MYEGMQLHRGLGILMKPRGAERYVFCRFDKAGSDLASRQVLYATLRVDNVRIEVTGHFDNGVIVVSAVREIE